MSKICNNFILSPVVIPEKYKYLEASCSLIDERKRNSRISTRGASKQRRDQINNELTEIRNILPLTSIMRQNLYQLQILSLCCTYIRCYNYLNIFNKNINNSSNSSLLFCTINALNDNFLIGITEEGNLLALSENFSQDKDPISTIEWMAQSDSIFDLLDPDDHQILKEIIFNENKIENNIAFVCRWKAPKLGGIIKRQPDWNGKPTLVNGRFISSQNGNKKMFIALCRPILFSENSFYKHKDPSIMRFWLDQNFRIEALCQK